jgi:hypothetical protein
MILIVASSLDDRASELLGRFQGTDAALLTPRDLSVSGISVNTQSISSGSLVADTRSIRIDRIGGIVTLIPFVQPDELVHITADDRAYVAREMTAFLTFVLAEISCAKLNPPTATCLSGPAWHQEHWVTLARRLEIPVNPRRRASPPGDTADDGCDPPAARVTVVGRQVVGSDDRGLQAYSQRLAHAASLNLLQVTFTRPTDGQYRFRSATQFPDVTENRVAAAITSHFEGGP